MQQKLLFDRKSGSHAFTLVEIMIVVGIIAAIGALLSIAFIRSHHEAQKRVSHKAAHSVDYAVDR